MIKLSYTVGFSSTLPNEISLVQFFSSRSQLFPRLSTDDFIRYCITDEGKHTRGCSKLFWISLLGTWGSLAWCAAIWLLVARPVCCSRWRSVGSLLFCCSITNRSRSDEEQTHGRMRLGGKCWLCGRFVLSRSRTTLALAVGFGFEFIEDRGHDWL